jgi:DHA1 family multidrug resistance protein-like MFS transporter
MNKNNHFIPRNLRNLIQFIRDLPRAVIFVFAIYFLQGVFHNLGHPVTPALVNSMGINNFYFGLYFAAMSFGLFIGAPIWGVLGDRGNKRLYIVLGLLVYSVGQYAFAFVGDKNVMILFRFISGFGVSASITLIMSHLIEHSQEHKRTVYLGLYQGLFVLGSSVGYFLGGLITEITWFVDVLHMDDYRNVFFLQAVLNVVHAFYIFFLIGKDRNTVHAKKRTNPLQGFLDIKLLDRNLLLFLLSLTLISLGAINISKYIEVYLNDVGLSAREIGQFVGATGIVSIMATVFIVPLVVSLKRDFTMMILTQLLSAIIVFFVFRSNQLLITLYTFFMLYIVLKSVYTPLEQHFISSHASSGEYGKIMGVRQSFFSIGMVIGPLLGGFLYEWRPLLVFDFSVLMFIIGFILLLIIGRNIRQKPIRLTE